MAENTHDIRELLIAVQFALDENWTEAHEIAQRFEHLPMANWLHAVLHKIEGDAGNARYWYQRSPAKYDDFDDAKSELEAIQRQLREDANT